MSARTVLNVEDSQDDAMLLQNACKVGQAGFRLQAVPNARQAMAYLQGEGPYADRAQYPLPGLILLDLKLPRISGLDLLAWIRQQPHWRELPIVVCSGSVHNADLEQARQLGANEFFVKTGGFQYLVQFAKAIDQSLRDPPSLAPLQKLIAHNLSSYTRPSGPWPKCTFPKPSA